MNKVSELKDTDAYKRIEKEVERFVEEKLRGYESQSIEGKTIHDSVWGSVEYSEWEMQIIDSPLLQRLRDIHQVGLAMLTYPAARHSRFEHSLGVAAAAKRMCERINSNTNGYQIPDETRDCIVLAALLHDVGHCFYSHLSEGIYGELQDFMDLRNEFYKKLDRKPKPHEILSFLIINTKAFSDFFSDNVDYPNKSKVKSSLFSDIGCMIVGAEIIKDNKVLNYQTAIINGSFDADKLDYIRRDSLTAGLALQYDIERLFTKIGVHEIPRNDNMVEYRLIIQFNGVTAIEELTFCKIMLFSYIYYHQKVLITETMIRDYTYGLCRLDIISDFADFLRYTDSEILRIADRQKNENPFPEYGGLLNLKELADNVRQRRLPKRCFEVSQSNVRWLEGVQDNKKLEEHCQKIIEECRNNKQFDAQMMVKRIELISSEISRGAGSILDNLVSEFRELTFTELLDKRKKLYDLLVDKYKQKNMSVTFSLFDVYIVFPKLVSYGTTTETVVLGRDRSEMMTVNDFIKLDDWAGSFNSNKWRGYVFVTDKIDSTIAFEAAQEFILRGKAEISNPTAYLKRIKQ